MTKTEPVSAHAAAPEIDDPLAASDPNPAYLAALRGALDLADESRVPDLARAVANPKRGDLVSALFCHELAACHRLMMRFGAMADQFLSHTSATIDPDRRQVGRDAIGFAAIAARLMARYQQGALALPKLRDPIVKEIIKEIVIDWGDDDDGPKSGAGGAGEPSPAAPADGAANGPSAAPGAASAAPLRRGKLKNGNRSGDFLAAPRCGAKTRAGCACRQPAMKNGRCRLHGGKSTGARTAAGRRRARTARLIHGRRTATAIGLRSAAAAVSRRLAWMTELAAGHGVDRGGPRPPTLPKVNHRGHRAHRDITPKTARAAHDQSISVASVYSVVNPSPAGHGVDRSDSTPPLGTLDAGTNHKGAKPVLGPAKGRTGGTRGCRAREADCTLPARSNIRNEQSVPSIFRSRWVPSNGCRKAVMIGHDVGR